MIKVPETCVRGEDQDYAIKTLPPGLTVMKSEIPNAGQGVFATENFPVRSRFGPYGGSKVKDRDEVQSSGYSWLVSRQFCNTLKLIIHFLKENHSLYTDNFLI